MRKIIKMIDPIFSLQFLKKPPEKNYKITEKNKENETRTLYY